MDIHPSPLPEVKLVTLEKHHDPRGVFFEVHHEGRYSKVLNSQPFLQSNIFQTKPNTLRGLHYQLKSPQAKLITVLEGEVIDVALDIRRNSPTFGEYTLQRLCASEGRQMYIPAGFAHGIAAIAGPALVLYQCSALYDPNDSYGIAYNDPDLAIPWPLKAPIVSEVDAGYPTLAEQPLELLPQWQQAEVKASC